VYAAASIPAFAAAPPLGFGSAVVYQATNKPEVAPNDAVAANLLAQGYALAGAGYASQGWAAAEGVEAGEGLIRHINSGAIKGVKGIRAWGPSLGGLVSATLAERNPGKIQGVLPICGALAGPEQAFSAAMTVLYSWKTLVAPTLRVANYQSYPQALGDLATVFTVLGGAATTPVTPVGYPLAQANLLGGLMAGLPTKSSVYDGITVNPIISVLAANPAIGPVAANGAASAQGYSPVSAGASSAVAMLQNVGTAAALGILGRYDLEQRARKIASIPATDSANFNDNVNVVYNNLLSPEQRGEFADTLNATTVMPNALNAMVAAMDASVGDASKRYAANPAAVAAIRALPAPKGTYKVPTVLMTTTYDPAVPDGNTGYYYDSLKASYAKSKSKAPFKAAAYYTVPPVDGWTKFEPGGKAPSTPLSIAALGGSGVGHCVFTGEQLIGSVATLDRMVKAKTAKGIKVANRAFWQVPGINGDGGYTPDPLKRPNAK
jgi:pimeloyl-ACP methyl ester carboxylesterase